jgi:hypothetical protein
VIGCAEFFEYRYRWVLFVKCKIFKYDYIVRERGEVDWHFVVVGVTNSRFSFFFCKVWCYCREKWHYLNPEINLRRRKKCFVCLLSSPVYTWISVDVDLVIIMARVFLFESKKRLYERERERTPWIGKISECCRKGSRTERARDRQREIKPPKERESVENNKTEPDDFCYGANALAPQIHDEKYIQ